MIETTTTSANPEKSISLVGEVAALVVAAVNLHHIDPNSLTEATSLRDGGLDLDSVDMLEVIVAVEQKFGVKVTDAETGKKYFRTLGGIADFVKANRAGT
jgi:acyl carrier protein